MKTRGIVMTNPFHSSDGRMIWSPPSSLDLRRYCLYWDQICWVQAKTESFGFISAGTGKSDVIALKEEGVLDMISVIVYDHERLHYGYSPDNPEEFHELVHKEKEKHPDYQYVHPPGSAILPIALVKASKELNKSTQLLWSIAQSTDEIRLPYSQGIDYQSIEVKLLNALPVPTQEISIKKILEFRKKRYSELLQLRSVIDDMKSIIVSTDDYKLANIKIRENLGRALREIEKALKDSQIKNIFSSADIFIDANSNQEMTDAVDIGELTGLGMNAAVGVGNRIFNDVINLSDATKEYVYIYNMRRAFPVDE